MGLSCICRYKSLLPTLFCCNATFVELVGSQYARKILREFDAYLLHSQTRDIAKTLQRPIFDKDPQYYHALQPVWQRSFKNANIHRFMRHPSIWMIHVKDLHLSPSSSEDAKVQFKAVDSRLDFYYISSSFSVILSCLLGNQRWACTTCCLGL